MLPPPRRTCAHTLALQLAVATALGVCACVTDSLSLLSTQSEKLYQAWLQAKYKGFRHVAHASMYVSQPFIRLTQSMADWKRTSSSQRKVRSSNKGRWRGLLTCWCLLLCQSLRLVG